MTPAAIRRLRVRNQRLGTTGTPGNVATVVSWMGAMQAQDFGAAKWAIGVRAAGVTDKDVEAAIDQRRIVRTWPMRGTLHFVAAEDVRWMLRLLSPRVITAAAARHRQLELDDAVFAQCAEMLIRAMEGKRALARLEIMEMFEVAGIRTAAQRGYHILWYHAQNGLICPAAPRGKEQTFALLEEWVPPAPVLDRHAALAALAARYFSSHGPAAVQDFAWWAGLTLTEARAGLEAVSSGLTSDVANGITYWTGADGAATPRANTKALLLPAFDEILLGYRDREALLDPAYAGRIVPGSNGVFQPLVLVDGEVVGTWRRAARAKSISITVELFRALSSASSGSLEEAAARYGRFHGLPASIQVLPP